MKKPQPTRIGRAALLSAAFITLQAPTADAAILYWDGNGTGATGNPPTGTTVGGAGTWTSAGPQWWNGTAYQAWNAAGGEDIADFRGSTGAVIVSGTVNVNQMLVRTNSYAFSGGTVNFTGAQGILDVFATSSSTFASGATGNLKVQSTGNTASLANAAPLTINGSTTLTSFELALATDNNHIILGNAAALGNASTNVKLTKGALNLGAVDGSSNFNYSAWTTDLAGGTIRARFNTGTWNGATTLSANAQLMTRNSTGVKLVFSNTATVNLNANTLNLMSGSSSGGIELNGVISGSGNLATIDNKLGGSDNGNGTTILGAANTFTGSATTTTNLGTLALGNLNALQNATLNTGAAAGTQAVTFTVAGTNTYNIGGLAGSDPLALGGNTISVGAKAGSHSFAADINGSGGLTKVGASSTQTLAAATSYTGATAINAGTLALGTSGALPASSNVSIAAGATLDTSAQATYTFDSASLGASGSGTTPGADAAELKGGTTIDLGTRPVALGYTPDSFTGDANDPALYVSSGSLSLSGPVSVANNSGTPLGDGTYVLISQASGSITGTPTLSGTVGGAGIAAGKSAVIQVSGGNLELLVQDALPTTVTLDRNISTSATSTYGDTLTFDVVVSPAAATGIVELRDGGATGTLVASGSLVAGTASLTPAANALTAGSHPDLVAVYLGDPTYQAGSSTSLTPAQVIAQKELTVTGATANSKYADGSTTATLSGGSLVGVVSGDESAVTLSQTGVFDSAAAGLGITVTATCSIDGPKSSNYFLTQPGGLFADIYAAAEWTGAVDTLWNTSNNWDPALVPSGANVTADFSTLDITTDQTVNLNSPRTIGHLDFGDTDSATAAGWTLANNATAANILTLAGTAPSVTVDGVDSSKAAIITAVVAGTDGLAKQGPGVLALNAANTYNGTTTVNDGTLRIGNAAALGNTAAGTTVNTNGTLDFNSIATSAEPVTLAGGKLANNGTADQGNALGGAATVTANSRIGGTRRWDVRAATSSLTINPGVTLTKEDGNMVIVVGRPFTHNGLIKIDGGSFGFHTGGTYTGPGTFEVNFGGQLELGSYGSATPLLLSANITSNGGSLTVPESSGTGGLPTFGGTISLATDTTTFLGGAGSGNFTNTISGDGNLTKIGNGTHTLTGTNSYTGTTTVSTGELRVGSNGAINGTSAIEVTAGGRLGIAGTVVAGASKSVTIAGTGGNFFGALQGASGTAEWQGGVVVADVADTRIGVNTGTFTVSGPITGGGTNGVMLRSNTGTLVLSGAASYAGDTRIICNTGGFVQLATAANRLPVGTRLIFGGTSVSGILDLNGQNQEVAGISVNSGTTNEVRSLTGAPVLTVNTPAATPSTYSGLLTGTLALTKDGPETLTLSGNNSYSGATVVNAGTLRINGNQSTATGPVTVNSATLGGSGTLGGAVEVSATGTIAPGGTTPATLTVASADLNPDGTLAIDIDDTATPKNDRLTATGTLDLTGAKLAFTVTGTPNESTYVVASATSITGTISPGNVTGLPAGYQLEQTSTEVRLVKAGFASWIAGFGLPAGDQDPTDDPDSDGVDNLTEFAFNGQPADGSNNGLTALALQDTTAPAGNELTLVAAVRDGAVFSTAGTTQTATVDGIVYTIEGSLDLVFPGSNVSTVAGASETTPAGTTLPDISGSGWEYRTFRLDASEGLPGKGFLRAKVTAP